MKGPRDPGRIGPLVELLQAYWQEHPDLRLAQILGNAWGCFGGKGENYAMEEDVLLRYLSWNDPAVSLPPDFKDVTVEDDEGNRWVGHRCPGGHWRERNQELGCVGTVPVRWRYA